MTQDRTKSIGGSDAAAVLGLSRWQSPLQVWAEKTGNLQQKDISDKICVKFGNKLENAVAEFFTEETGKKVHRVNETLIHPEHDFITANLDRRIVGEKAILECKTCSPFKAKEWGDDIPSEYLIQCYHYLAVTGYDRAYIAVLIGNQDFKYKVVERDEQIINDIISKEVAFWNDFVLTGNMPMASANDNDTLYELFPECREASFIDFDEAKQDEVNIILDNLDALKQDRTQIENRIKQLENQIKQELKDNEACKTDRFKVTWKKQSQTRINSKKLKEEQPEVYNKYTSTSEFKVLRVSEVKDSK